MAGSRATKEASCANAPGGLLGKAKCYYGSRKKKVDKTVDKATGSKSAY